MIELTYDTEARTLYAYFTEIDEGQDTAQVELPGSFLLDEADQLLGLHIELGEERPEQLLRWALQHPQVQYEQGASAARIIFAPGDPATTVPFVYDAILDLDRDGRALGAEFIADPEFGLEHRL